MKPLVKLLSCVAVSVIISACGSDHETVKPTDNTDNSKPAVRLYFAENIAQRIGIIDLKKPGAFKALLDYDHNNLGIPGGIAVNQTTKRLYISEQDGSRIWRINLDSTTFKLVYDSDRGIAAPAAIAVDSVGKTIYWANNTVIMKGDPYGSIDPVALFDGASVVNLCYGIAIDHKNNKIYFADNNLHKISVGNLDGSGTPTTLYDDNNTTNVGCPSGLVLSDGKLYWADNCFNSILAANADGTGKPSILFNEDDGISFAEGIAIDKASKKIYWSESDGSVVASGNLDGSGTREIILENVQPTSISLEFP
jgi:DNA-binding beta-propeller fold protein YncE